jgi:hypothetical protein
MTIHERMVPRSEREKDLLKYGRSQERQRIIKELEANEHIWRERVVLVALTALIKGETNDLFY